MQTLFFFFLRLFQHIKYDRLNKWWPVDVWTLHDRETHSWFLSFFQLTLIGSFLRKSPRRRPVCEIQYCQVAFRPPSFVQMKRIWIVRLPMHLSSERPDRPSAGNESCVSSRMQRWIILSMRPGGARETHCFSSLWNVITMLTAVLLTFSVWCRSYVYF